MLHAISLAAVLFGLWLLLSGHFTTLLLSLGGVSAILVVVIAARMDVVDHEGHPIRLGLRALTYWPWLALQIVVSNIDVARRILSPSRPIQPEVFTLRAHQRTDLGQVIFANSITLTPGTVTVECENGELIIHALTREAADELRKGRMNRLVAAFEGQK